MVEQTQNESIPKWLATNVDAAGLQKISDAVARVEEHSSAEIVPIVVRRSSAIGHVRILLLLGTWFFVGILALDFGVDVWTIAALIIGSFCAWFLTDWSQVQSLLTSERDQIQQVALRAELEFFKRAEKKTEGATGILIFVSLMERRAIVLGDKMIASRIPPERWHDVVSVLVSGIKQGEFAKGFVKAIERCGEIVKPHFPPGRLNPNELVDRLIILD